jgi:hypothetical protein
MQRLVLQKDRRCVTASLLEGITTKSDASILLIQKRCPVSDSFYQESHKNVKITQKLIDRANGGEPSETRIPPPKKNEREGEHSFG